jgi:hypothetical protein
MLLFPAFSGTIPNNLTSIPGHQTRLFKRLQDGPEALSATLLPSTAQNAYKGTKRLRAGTACGWLKDCKKSL